MAQGIGTGFTHRVKCGEWLLINGAAGSGRRKHKGADHGKSHSRTALF